MKKYLIIREPIELTIRQILEIEKHKDANGFRRATLDDGEKVDLYESSTQRSFNIGDLIHYDISIDEFTLFDPTKIHPRSKLVEITSEQ